MTLSEALGRAWSCRNRPMFDASFGWKAGGPHTVVSASIIDFLPILLSYENWQICE